MSVKKGVECGLFPRVLPASVQNGNKHHFSGGQNPGDLRNHLCGDNYLTQGGSKSVECGSAQWILGVNPTCLKKSSCIFSAISLPFWL